jgi:ketosteroid isomerase-like protein
MRNPDPAKSRLPGSTAPPTLSGLHRWNRAVYVRIQYSLLRDSAVATRTITNMAFENIEIVQQIYKAFANQDLEGLLSLVHPDCVVTQDASLPWGGRYVGHEGVTAFALTMIGAIDSSVTVESLFEADGQVIQCGRTKGNARANGNAFDVPEVHVWTFKEGKVVAAHFAIDTAAMLAALA